MKMELLTQAQPFALAGFFCFVLFFTSAILPHRVKLGEKKTETDRGCEWINCSSHARIVVCR